MQNETLAPGGPGIPATWTSGAKSGVGTAYNPTSSVWFTISHGVLNEIYFPRVDQACTRDVQFIVTDGESFFSEERRETTHEIHFLADGVPAYRIVNTCKNGYYKIEKEIITDPVRNCVLQKVKFKVLKGDPSRYHLYLLLAPHLGNYGAGNTAWIGDYKGETMLFAVREDSALSLACDIPWKKASVGYVGTSDGWQDINKNKRMTWEYQRAENGNVALTGEIDLNQVKEDGFVLALGFSRKPMDAAQRARASIMEGFENAKKNYIHEWKEWQKTLASLRSSGKGEFDFYRISTSVLKTHAAKRLPGGLIASLSIPWGFSKGDDDIGGYHLVWPRDLVETAGGLLAAKACDDVKKVLNYLMVTQEADGHWAQNMWLDGTSYWHGIQLDETSFPILLVELARKKGALKKNDIAAFWPMVKKAVTFIIAHGPSTQQDRWEENAGYTPFTIAVEIAALLIAAELAELSHEPEMATFIRETADAWNDSIERWLYITNNDVSKDCGVDGYYVRVNPDEPNNSAIGDREVMIKNLPAAEAMKKAKDIISPDALALVRFGLRAADDERILNTVKVIDKHLRVETPNGPCWYRYSFDGYGEHEDGNPYNGTGKGRLWPLLTGERAHYEIALGRISEAKKLLKSIEAFANEGGMLPEQVWDTQDIPEKDLYFGEPSGSAMPLVWAHAEYITLCRSIRDKKVFDMPDQTRERYIEQKVKSSISIWSFVDKIQESKKGKKIRVQVLAPCILRWTTDNWKTVKDTYAEDSGMGIFYIDIPTSEMESVSKIQFTFKWTLANKWENTDFSINLI